MRFYFMALGVLAIDQFSKIWVRLKMDVGESMLIWDRILHFTRYENSGIARSMLEGYGRLFVPIAMLFVVMVLYSRKKGHLQGLFNEIGAALLVGGALGNAIDRILYNQVTDFISFSFMDGILNIADYAIMWGGILMVIGAMIEGVRFKFIHAWK